jgi:DNA-binding response OmpR family regulator
MCDRCPELEERIAWLESELGLQQRADRVERIKTLFPLDEDGHAPRPQCAEFLLVLYNAKGRPVTHLQIVERVPAPRAGEQRDMEVAKVWAHVTRRALGHDAIRNIRGFGYQLTEVGMARVAEALAC